MTPVWWLLAFIPALVVLYFLKLKRQNVTVSSTLLWKRSLEDLHVNSPFQRLRRSLLFLLQLLMLCLLIVAVWRPRCNLVETAGRNLLVFVDNSASMSAREEGGTRLELAREEALRLVRTMTPTDRMMVMSFAGRTVTVQPLTSDQALLEAKIRSIRSTSLPTDLVSALSSAYSLAESLPTAEIYVLSDGCYPELSEVPPEVQRLNVRFPGKAEPLDNMGITEADVRRTFGREPRTEVFALVSSLAKDEREVVLSLFHEDQRVDARELTIPPGEARRATFDITGLASGIARLEIDGADALPDDDRVWLEVSPPPRITAVLVGEENEWIDRALASNRNVAHARVSRGQFVSEEMKEFLEGSEPPVVIFDRWVPEEVPPVPAIFVACRPPGTEGTDAPEKEELPVIIDWDHSHPVNRFLVYNDVGIAESFILPRSERLRCLVESDKGCIVGVLSREGKAGGIVPAVLIGFDILKSDWALKHYSFPIFFTNAVTWLGTGQGETRSRWRTGEPLVHSLKMGGEEDSGSRPEVAFRAPDGGVLPAVLEKDGPVVLGRVDQVGVYDLVIDSESRKRFGVGLLSEAESDLRPLDEIDFGSFSVPAQTGMVREPQDLWSWFALAALAIMLLEWYVYHRRVYV